jgi:hypothetical protein
MQHSPLNKIVACRDPLKRAKFIPLCFYNDGNEGRFGRLGTSGAEASGLISMDVSGVEVAEIGLVDLGTGGGLGVEPLGLVGLTSPSSRNLPLLKKSLSSKS